jgi:hypothetical protein
MDTSDAMVALDSNTMTYFIEAFSSGDGGPTGPLAAEQIALARIYFWSPSFCYRVTPVIESEFEAIKDAEKRDNHKSFALTLIMGVRPLPDPELVESRAEELLPFHRGANDRKLIAECEMCEIDALLTCDAQLLKNLKQAAKGVTVCTPSEYWARMAVAPGTRPQAIPATGNPLAGADWWHWP